jgi:alkylated DNA repair dioxygenase AlkB
VDYRRGWLRGAEQLFDLLHHEVPWHAERREMYERVVDVPRLLTFYDGGEALPHPVLTEAREALSRWYAAELGEQFVTAGMCLYRDGRDSVAWHGDRVGRAKDLDTMVAIVSVGSARSLMLRPRGGGQSLGFSLGHGDLVVMGGSCQRTWDHCIPKTAKAVGPRISIQFRPRGIR